MDALTFFNNDSSLERVKHYPTLQELTRILDSKDLPLECSGLYYPPADGFTDEDFVNFAKTFDKNDTKLREYRNSFPRKSFTYRVEIEFRKFLKTVEDNDDFSETEKSRWLEKLFTTFPRKDEPYSAGAARTIKMNEFLNYSKNITLKEFLEDHQEELKDYCKNLDLKIYDHTRLLLNADLPGFLKLDKRVTTKTGETLLEMTRDQLFELYSSPKVKSLSTRGYHFSGNNSDYAADWIKAVTDERFKESLEFRKIDDYIASALLSNYQELHNFIDFIRRAPAESYEAKAISNSLVFIETVLGSLRKYQGQGELVRAYLSLIIQEDALKDFSIADKIAFIYGVANPQQWCRLNTESQLYLYLTSQILKERISIHESISLIARIVKYSDERALALENTTDFSPMSNKETPLDWILPMMETVDKTVSLSDITRTSSNTIEKIIRLSRNY